MRQKALQDARIAELTKQLGSAKAGNADEIAELEQSLSEVHQQLAERDERIAGLKKDVSDLTAKQVATALDLVAAKALDSKAVVQMKEAKAASDSQISALNQQIAELQSGQFKSGKENDGLKQSLADSQKQLAETSKQLNQLKSAQNEHVKANAGLKLSLSDSQNQIAALTKQLSELQTSQSANDKANGELKQSLADSQKQNDELASKWKAASDKLDEQDKQLNELRKTPAVIQPDLKAAGEIQSYALGTLWGQEVITAMNKIQASNFSLKLPQVIGGVTDSINGKLRLPEDKLIAALDTVNQQVMSQNRAAAKTTATGDQFIQSFSKKPGAKRSDLGYYYRITETGKGRIKDTDTVAITVKESLSSGKVIKDMAKAGKVLALPVKNYPPLFASAISQMNNKGKMVMVVPPELAYGPQGKPPEIPPGSTMVYEITIVDVKPE